MVIFLLFLRVVFIIFSTHDISILLLCMYTKTHFHNIAWIFTHAHRFLGQETCQEHLLSSACASSSFPPHTQPPSSTRLALRDLRIVTLLLLFFIPYRASPNYIRLTVVAARVVSVYSHIVVFTPSVTTPDTIYFFINFNLWVMTTAWRRQRAG